MQKMICIVLCLLVFLGGLYGAFQLGIRYALLNGIIAPHEWENFYTFTLDGQSELYYYEAEESA